MIPTRLEETNQQYAIKAKTVCSQAAQAYGHTSPYTVPPLTVVEHLIGRKPTIARNTWKQYKNALRYHFQSQLAETPEKVLAEELQAAISMLDSTSSDGTLKFGTQTSARKQKGFKKADYDKLLTYLAEHVGKHRHARALMTWLKATHLAGLRPSEWEYASLGERQGKRVLIVQNAKATNGRGHGEDRSLDIEDLSPDELQAIEDMVEMLEGYRAEIDFATLQIRIGDYMKYATRQCFGKRQKYPSLYSLRHQFSANAKFSGSTKKELAAMMGHGSDATAGTHYARKASGDSAVKVAPLDAEVKRVRAKAKTFTPRPKQPTG
ncbi:hypothetical protein [Chromobacterium haemolyticum]|uniref:hypothetical protein n=1 Tax=Chromobacterium haemolyticum TaxID=394935 RepID=UPI00244758B8|nr:hypothetical protein [Chromobacterium haemolyticum]MDH0341975.1 hypothetical protein [Chromobacterium haemolyticum]